MTAAVKSVPKYEGNTLDIVRVFDAPRALVWTAWTEKEHALKWSGPRDYPVIEADHDIRPGGKWRSCLKGADGEELWQGGVYKEVVPEKKLVFTFRWDTDEGTPQGETLITVEFADKDGGTEMRFRQEGFTGASTRDGHRGGWNSSFDRLAEFLAAERS